MNDKNKLVYGVDETPRLPETLLLALQHILAAFAGIVAVPLVIGSALKLSSQETALMVSATVFASGLTTIIQSKYGSRLANMMGTDFTFVNPSIAVGAKFGIAGIVTATMTGALVELVLSRFIRPLMRFFPPLVIGIVVSLIGMTLLPVSIDWMAGGVGSDTYGSPLNLAIGLLVLVFTLFLNHFGKGLWKTGAVFIGLVFGYLIAIPFGLVDFTAVGQATWFEWPNLLRYGVKFDLASTLSFIPAYLVSAIGTVGVIMATGEASQVKVDSDRLSSGVLVDGLGSILSGLFGAGPNTDFSQNVGLISLTKVASRQVMVVAGLILAGLGLFPKVAALISVMPSPVLGGVGVIMFGLVAAQGINSLSQIALGDRELLIMSVAFAFGIGVTVRPEMLSGLPGPVQMIFSSGISTGTLVALVLNLLLPERK